MNGKVKESNIVTQICNYLQLLENQGKLYFIRNNSGAAKVGKRFFRFGKKGSSDIILFFPGKEVIFIEVKNEKGQMTESQYEFSKKIVNLGYKYVLVRSLNEVYDILNRRLNERN